MAELVQLLFTYLLLVFMALLGMLWIRPTGLDVCIQGGMALLGTLPIHPAGQDHEQCKCKSQQQRGLNQRTHRNEINEHMHNHYTNREFIVMPLSDISDPFQYNGSLDPVGWKFSISGYILYIGRVFNVWPNMHLLRNMHLPWGKFQGYIRGI